MTKKLFASTKTYTHAQGLSCCFRQWRATSHCRLLHGYALEVKIEFLAKNLDENNWVVDFGGLKDIKKWLEDTFDHKLLVADDDPYRHMFLSMQFDEDVCNVTCVPATGCEAFAALIFDYVESWIDRVDSGVRTRVVLKSVEVREHGGNSAICYNRTVSVCP